MTRDMATEKVFVKETNTPRACFITKTTETLATWNKNKIIIWTSGRVASDTTK